MKKIIITLIMAFKMTAVNADAIESKIPRHIGFWSGAAVGAAVAGPVGVIVGGTLGAFIGHDVGRAQVLARKNQELDDLHRDIAHARSKLALVNAARAKTQAELVAFRKLLTGLYCGRTF